MTPEPISPTAPPLSPSAKTAAAVAATPPPWRPAPLLPPFGHVAGSALRRDGGGLVLSIVNDRWGGDSSVVARRVSETRQLMEEDDRQAIRAEVEALPVDPIAEAQAMVARLTREKMRFECISDEWVSRHRRLEIEGADAALISEAEAAFHSADRGAQAIDEQLARAVDEAAGFVAKRKRDVSAIAERVVSASTARLKTDRAAFLQALLQKIAPELEQLAALEAALAVGDRAGVAVALAAEMLTASEKKQ